MPQYMQKAQRKIDHPGAQFARAKAADDVLEAGHYRVYSQAIRTVGLNHVDHQRPHKINIESIPRGFIQCRVQSLTGKSNALIVWRISHSNSSVQTVFWTVLMSSSR
jgi:hypothetical protein